MRTVGEPVLISYEGIEESGKTTHSKRLYRFLQEKGLPVVWTFEPGGDALLQRVRKYLLEEAGDLPAFAELFVFLADRSLHMERVIEPALERGNIVIVDRFIDSTSAYQGYGRGIDLALIRQLNNLVTGYRKPDLTVLIDIPGEMAARRLAIRQERDRIEDEDIAFFERVRQGFLRQAQEDPQRFLVLDGLAPILQNELRARERALGVLRAKGWKV